MSQLGERVKELRLQQHLTQLGVAEKGGFSMSLISALETGRRKYVTPQDVEQLAMGLGVPDDELWEQIPGGRREERYISLRTA